MSYSFIRQSSRSHYAIIRQSLGSHQAVIRQSSGSHQTVILIYLVLSSIELDCTLYYITVTLRYTEALKLHCFLKKNPLQYIDINLTKCGFELHGFFLEPKTAYLKALLYCPPFSNKIFLIQVCNLTIIYLITM